MSSNYHFHSIAVLGAGVMGAQIAAHCLNAGFAVKLYDLPSDKKNKNELVEKAIARLAKLKPMPLGDIGAGTLIEACNYQDDLEKLGDCDLIIEAIGEKLEWKEALYKQIAPFIQDDAVLVSNTSGLSINQLCNVLPESLQMRFCGVHFFNPPRYMHLAELIPAHTSSQNLLNRLENWLVRYLGKGVVRAKDTPNFIANRIGVFSMLCTLHHAMRFELGLDEVDALTGVLIGRPKSATFRTMDVVGLDTMQHVVKTMQEQLGEDPWHKYYLLPRWMNKLIESGALGQKSGKGIYQKQGKTILVFDPVKGDYRQSAPQIDEQVLQALKGRKDKGLIKALQECSSKQADFLLACFYDLFHYCAVHLQDIADTTRDVDQALRWGFGWQEGPFETWQQSGISNIVETLLKQIETQSAMALMPLPHWVGSAKAFYTESGSFSPSNNSIQGRSELAVYQRQFNSEMMLGESPAKRNTLYENEGVILWVAGDDIAALSFKSKANTIGLDVLEGILASMEKVISQYQGLIIYQDNANNFSSGANLEGVVKLLQNKKYKELEEMIARFQYVAMQLKYSSIPTIAAVRGRALGGGCELMMHCNATVAAFESYPGLVELGVGLIPAGGGCKEFARRAGVVGPQYDVMDALQPYFEQIATATVASSAVDATKRHFLTPNDVIMMNANEVLFAAKQKILTMQQLNFLPPITSTFKVAGREGAARLKTGLVNWYEGGFISAHDYKLASCLAYVLCGGDVDEGTLVNEQWILKLERDVFLELAQTEESIARMQHLLKTGKPLRN